MTICFRSIFLNIGPLFFYKFVQILSLKMMLMEFTHSSLVSHLNKTNIFRVYTYPCVFQTLNTLSFCSFFLFLTFHKHIQRNIII